MIFRHLLKHLAYPAQIERLTAENRNLRRALQHAQRQNAALRTECRRHQATARHNARYADRCATQKWRTEERRKTLREERDSLQHTLERTHEQRDRYRAYIRYTHGNNAALQQHRQQYPARVPIDMEADLERLKKEDAS